MGTSVKVGITLPFLQDHPHAYGDKVSITLVSSISPGSSPRVWGQVKAALEARTSGGIIPTRMGTSITLPMSFLIQWDHPHAYGDKTEQYTLIGGAGGSSPRVWGQGSSFFLCFLPFRIIPTRMGTSYNPLFVNPS